MKPVKFDKPKQPQEAQRQSSNTQQDSKWSRVNQPAPATSNSVTTPAPVRSNEQRQGARGPSRLFRPSEPLQDTYDRNFEEQEDEATGEDDADEEVESTSRSGSQWGSAGDGEYRAPTIRNELVEGVLYGVFPVLNALKAGRRKVHALYVLSTLDLSKRKDASAMREVFKLAKAQEVVVHKVARHELNLLSDDRQHQGLVLDCSHLEWSNMDTFPTASSIEASNPGQPAPVWLALDEVMDPQNFGAVLRSAHCLGASGILACSRNCAPLSPTVSKASAGVLEVSEVHSCHNMVKTLSQAVADGWEVLGAVADHRAQLCRDVAVTKPTILVVGNEGSGLRTNIKRACSGFIKVEMALPRQQLAADSLNVSVAAGILMHSLVGAAAASCKQAAAAGGVEAAATGSVEPQAALEAA